MGEEIPVDDCVACPDGGYQEYRLTVLHFALDKEVQLIVRKTGGDLCQLDGDTVRFQCSLLLMTRLLKRLRNIFQASLSVWITM